jgi:hypothetical protein
MHAYGSEFVLTMGLAFRKRKKWPILSLLQIVLLPRTSAELTEDIITTLKISTDETVNDYDQRKVAILI